MGKTEEAQEYAQVAEQVRKAMQEEYVTSTGRLAADTQTALVLALHFHIVPDWAKERTVQELKRKLDEEVFMRKAVFPWGHPIFFLKKPDEGSGLFISDHMADRLYAVGGSQEKRLRAA